MTVHALPVPEVVDDRRRTASGRWKMLAVLAVCAAPVIASYLTYFVIRPETRTNYGTLITPPREIPAALGLQDLAGRPVESASLKRQWLLLAVGDAACDARCERQLVLMRQLRETLGRDRDRVDKVWLLPDAGTPTERLLEASGGVSALHADRAALAAWLAPADGHRLEDHLYIVDPMGQWMMRVPADPEPAKVKRDLERLLRASASWDQAGR
ncbi:hypothetical protein ABXN37_14335 [Piscinibacter sakaiensis]|uniref:Transmembrane protein n=2 Tax=Piscinibacter sakaiensis TaxID=1547922 RepID=A0A0K8P0Y6_PISS1|nr:hypothetical protein [Piscinibacter sakaiensis]GAP36322.1 hypothetical protein ISF6_2162 [Piscinibacter sakaiensis]